MADGTDAGEENIFLKTRPAGHFYSPIPDLKEVLGDADRVFPDPPPREFAGVAMHGQRQVELMEELAPLADFSMAKEANSGSRFYETNGWFTPLDCRVLVGMMRKFAPKRIVEVGSGFSTNDILFIDSAHVSKIGSDLNHLVFEVLPRLQEGVVVHFHDILYPFEYPRDWVERGFAWNEAYLLRAFLQFNTQWEILLYNSYLTAFYRDRLIELYSGAASSGGLWLRRCASD